MSEYIVNFGDDKSSAFVRLAMAEVACHGAKLREEVVRCRDCKFYEPSRWYESAIFPPLGTDIEHVCTFFADGVKVEPDGFCKWASRRES